MAWVAAEEAVGDVWDCMVGAGRREWSAGRVGGGGEGALEWSRGEEEEWWART